MDKRKILKAVIGQLNKQLDTMRHAARASHDAATGSESKSEGKYDTRGLEASYLADAQAEQCEKISRAVHLLGGFSPVENPGHPTAEAGTVVEVESAGSIQYYFLLPCGGGITLEHEGCDVTTLTPDAPLYQSMLGAGHGDLIEDQDLLILDIM